MDLATNEELMAALRKATAHEQINRNLIKGLSKRIERLETGDPPEPQDTPPALRAEEV